MRISDWSSDVCSSDLGQAACSEASGVLSNEGRVRRHVIEPAALIWAASESAGDGMDRRNFIGSAALAALLPLVGGGSAIAATRERLLPVALSPGDTVGLVSPSSAKAGRLSLQLAGEVMPALGFKVKTGPHYASRYGGLAGTDAERAGDINEMFADEGVKAEIGRGNARTPGTHAH